MATDAGDTATQEPPAATLTDESPPMLDDETATAPAEQEEPDDAQSIAGNGYHASEVRPEARRMRLPTKAQLYSPEIATIRVGDEKPLEVDLTACAPQAGLFAAIRAQRRSGKKGVLRLGIGKESPSSAAKEAKASVGGAEKDAAGSEETEVSREASQEVTTTVDDVDIVLSYFPGGNDTLQSIIRYLEVLAAEERAAAAVAGELGIPSGVLKVDPDAFHLEFAPDTIGDYLEAAAVLRCPRLLRDTVLAPAAKDLSSRRVLQLLERVIHLTSQVDGPELIFGKSEEEGAGNREQVAQAFQQVIQRLCARLDAVDFRLSAMLAAGRPWASLEVLQAYRVKNENVGRAAYAFQSVTSTFKSLFTDGEEKQKRPEQQQKQEWKEHHFALHVFRRHIVESTPFAKSSNLDTSREMALLEQEAGIERQRSGDEPEGTPQQTDDDIPEAVCDGVTDETLMGLSGFVSYCDPHLIPGGLAAVMIRSLLLVDNAAHARTLFDAVFAKSHKAQAMIVNGKIPVDFLSDVKSQRAASMVLRRRLAKYETLDRAELCDLVGRVLLEEFYNEKHCHDLVISNPVIQDLVVHCRVATCDVAGRGGDLLLEPALCSTGEEAAAAAAEVPEDGSGAERSEFDAQLRLREIGRKLFNVTFTIQNGFLPLNEDVVEETGAVKSLRVALPEKAECPWDSDKLDLPILAHVPMSDDALHLARQVLLRGLFRRQRANVDDDVSTTEKYWSLGRWSSCREPALIAQAFRFLSNCWRKLCSSKAAVGASEAKCHNRMEQIRAEESLFKMFSGLEFWRLQPKELLTPWLPPQVVICHISARCKHLDEQQRSLSEDNRQNLEEINRLRHTISQLSSKLEAVDSRSVQSMRQQSQVGETLRMLR
eukprot:gnl/TRDRNA2_/TRDRNA2_131314_c0_seq2.p1 gnl/TRDRNA2_/TRDRNA2_131314_c0~~gnl/TRDRNA2_/TRDRNA2_131314_c0_seq2.p1  ORF type:complete len:880 (-),score=192.00 gnl/TRDRNA2_/TRDRNA2_131314_c0_seq2:88-2727(-)